MEEQTKKEEPVQRKILWGKQMPFQQFVALSRIAVNKIQISPFCRLRRCARKGRCAGKLMRRKIPRDLGGSDDLTVWLPLCIAGADDQWLEGFIDYWDACRDEYFGTLVNAYLAQGGRAIGVKAGSAYVDVGTVDGYRAASHHSRTRVA